MVDISNTVTAGIAMIVIMIALLATLPIVIEQVEASVADADAWNFTGAAGAESLLGLLPFAWIAGIVIFAIAGAFMLSKGLKGDTF
jgi:hypothetical protein